MALSERYIISRKITKCSVTQLSFQEGQRVWTAIFSNYPEAEYIRRDYSEEGWEKRPEEDLKPFSTWHSVWKAPLQAPAKPHLGEESIETHLQRLIDEDLTETEDTRYLLALILERKRVLIETSALELPDCILREYKQKKSGNLYVVKDPNLPLDQISALQEKVIAELS